MSRKPKIQRGHGSTPGPRGAVGDVIIIAILVLCMFIAIVPMWHTVMADPPSDGQLVIAHEESMEMADGGRLHQPGGI